MTVVRVFSRTLSGVQAIPVTVEVHLAGGLPCISVVGLAETSVKESRDRVKAAIINAGFQFPRGRVVISLSPADVRKSGSRFDLPIALGILAAHKQMSSSRLHTVECIGELGLSGDLRSIKGVLPTSLGTASSGRELIVPSANGNEAALCEDTVVRAAQSLIEVVQLLTGQRELLRVEPRADSAVPGTTRDMSDVKGQLHVKRAFEIAAAGAHNILLSGPPGTGKSMLARRMPGILPTMTSLEATETASVASISSNGFDPSRWRIRPFRSPHHTASGVALVGGGSPPRPGEVSLSHNGVLFLDELPEFPRSVLDVLREPMETGEISISRANWQADFPARFQIVAAMNPCPCGYYGDPEIECRCTPDQVTRYQSRISGPFLDRIDMTVPVPRLNRAELRNETASGESSEEIRQRIESARVRQQERQGCTNAFVESKFIEKYGQLSNTDADLFDTISEKLKLSLRSHVRVIKLARTIADLAGEDSIKTEHLLEAVSYRNNPMIR